MHGDFAYVAGAEAGPLVVDFAQRDEPRIFASYLHPSVVVDVAVDSGTAYLAIADGGLAIIDLEPDAAAPKAWLQTDGRSRAIAVSGRHAFLADGSATLDDGSQVPSALVVIDVSQPDAPEVVSSVALSGEARDVAVAGEHAYVAGDASGLLVLDVTDPAAPTEVAVLTVPGRAVGLTVQGQLAYVAAEDGGVRVVDITNPTAPVEVGAADTPGLAIDVAVSADDYAFVLCDNVPDSLAVYDVVDSSAPSRESVTPLQAEGLRLQLAGELVHIACGNDGLRIVSAADVSHPVVEGIYHTAGSALDAIADGSNVYVADGIGGLLVVRIEESTTPTAVTPGASETPGTPGTPGTPATEGTASPTPATRPATPEGPRWKVFLPVVQTDS